MFSTSSVSIFLQNNTLHASSYSSEDSPEMTLYGSVVVNTASALKIKSVTLHFSGRLSLHLPTTIKKSHRVLTDQIITLVQHKRASSISGQCNFPFQILVPSDLPESFHRDFGKIKYTLKALVKTSFINSDLKAEVPIYMQRNVNLLEEPSEERVFEMQSSDMFTGTVTLPTTEFAPGEKFNIQVTALTEQVSGVRNISCTLKEYTQFHVPLSQNQTREFQGRYMKILNSTNSLWSGNEHTKVIPLTIPENTSFGCVNSMVDIYHELSVRVYFTSKNGEIEYVTINIPIHTISFDDSSESEQLPCYNATELPPSYAATTQCAEMGAVCVPERC